MVDGVLHDKPCISIDLKTEAGRDIAKRLVAKADVVCSNFTPPVMAAFGLGPDDLRAIKPDLIVMQLSGYGAPGPWAAFAAYGPSTEAAGGMNALMGREGDHPVRVGSGVFSDQLSGRYAALALLAALERRRRTGEGRYLDLSMTEAITHLLGNHVLAAALNGSLPARLGNRDAAFAPQGIYGCRGEDEWIAITVKGDGQWGALVELVDDDRLRSAELATPDGRRRGHDEIDAVLAEWTAGFEKTELAELFQSRGIAAGPVYKVKDPLFDPHLAARRFFQMVKHERPLLGFAAHPHPTTPWVAEGRARHRLTDIRAGGADNYRVLKRWIGLGRREVTRLAKAGALIEAAPIRIDEAPGAPALPRDSDFGERLGLPPATGEPS